MRLKRTPRTWHSSVDTDTDSEVNDTEPLLSDASLSSRRSFGTTVMFPDASETSDLESTRPSAAVSKSVRSPYFLQSISNAQKEEVQADMNRFQYYSQLKSFIRNDNTEPANPDHVIPSSVFRPFLPGSDQEAGKQSSIVTIFAIWNTIMGSSLLAMPWGIEKAGLANGIVIMVLVGALCLYTAYILLRVQKLHGGNSPEMEASDLAGLLLGRNCERIAKTFSLIVLLGANIVYWVLMSNFLFNSVDYIQGAITDREGHNSSSIEVRCPWNTNTSAMSEALQANTTATQEAFYKVWNLEVTVPLFLILLIAPLVNFKSATFFTKFNSLGTLSVMYLICFVIVKASKWGINVDFQDTTNPFYVSNFNVTFPALTGMLALALFIHNIIITVMRNNRHQENNGRDLSVAFCLVIATYLTVGVLFHISFPLNKDCIQDNLLNNFESWDWMTVVARMFLFFQLLTVYPLIAYMLRVQLFTTFLDNVYPGVRHVLFLNTIIIFACVMFAIFLPRIGTIIRFTGAISGFVYIFTLPGALHLASLRKRGKLTLSSILLHSTITILGFANLIAQFLVNEETPVRS